MAYVWLAYVFTYGAVAGYSAWLASRLRRHRAGRG